MNRSRNIEDRLQYLFKNHHFNKFLELIKGNLKSNKISTKNKKVWVNWSSILWEIEIPTQEYIFNSDSTMMMSIKVFKRSIDKMILLQLVLKMTCNTEGWAVSILLNSQIIYWMNTKKNNHLTDLQKIPALFITKAMLLKSPQIIHA